VLSLAQSALVAAASHAFGLRVLGLTTSLTAPLRELVLKTMSAYFPLNMLTFGLMAGTVHGALYYRDLRHRQLTQADLEARVARAELDLLRMQLQPHFFFNTLHTVSALMEHDVRSARHVLTALGDLLRLSIDQMTRPEVSLREEVEFVEHYVDIQQARFGHRLAVQMAFPPDVLGALVPSLVLQPLVENAIRHGIEPHTRAGRVSISAAREGDRLLLVVHDDGPGRHGGTASIVATLGARRGIGLANLSARLQRIYGAAHRFEAIPDPTGGFRASLAIPFRTDTNDAVQATSMG
jgi:LytS/YehU family sensor histidine kinase